MSESFLEILPLIIVGLVWVLAMSKKKNNQRQQTHEEHHGDEYVPDMKNLGFPQEWKDDASKVDSRPIVLQEAKVEAVKPMRSKRVRSIETSDSHTKTSTDNNALDDFDLRKAVIYSEILKPKYDE